VPGNICRSPIGEYVLRAGVGEAGLSDRVVVDSAGVGGWHVGQSADRRSVRCWPTTASMPATTSCSRSRGTGSAATTRPTCCSRWTPPTMPTCVGSHRTPRLRMFREFDPALASLPRGSVDLDVPDPYYGDQSDFEDVYAMIAAGDPRRRRPPPRPARPLKRSRTRSGMEGRHLGRGAGLRAVRVVRGVRR
jgi:protein-tyrosine phosphatase